MTTCSIDGFFKKKQEEGYVLTNLVKVTEDLLSVAIVLGLLLAFAKTSFPKSGRKIVIVGALAGLAASILMAVLNNTTNWMDTKTWNMRMLIIWIAAFVVFAILFSKLKKEENSIGKLIAWIALAAMVGSVVGHAFPSVWGYPYSFTTADTSVLSTEFLYKLIGYLFGLILAFLAGLSIYQGSRRLKKPQLNLWFWVMLIVQVVQRGVTLVQVLQAKRVLKSSHLVFMITKFANNQKTLFIYAMIVIAIIIFVLLWIASFRQNDPYRNPAEHRKIKAKWRTVRRWATTILITSVLGLLVITAVKAYDSREVELSPVEDATIENGNVYVPFEQVEDGHLHRFAYVTDDGTQIRFIVIKKPNSSSYGIGLDACDICGETGYYEKDGQVVCKLCDVVMNISTIGFKGGCNPIVIDYSLENGQIVVPIDGLLEYEDVFKR